MASDHMTDSFMDMPPKRFLVSGGAGFIGYRVVDTLLTIDASAEVAVLDNLSVGMPMPIGRARLATYEGDIRDRKRVERVVVEFRPDTIIHLAAVHLIPTCERQRAYSLDVNLVGTETLLEAAEAEGVERFVLASSGAVYDWRDGALDETDTPLRPSDNYSLAKRTNECQLAFWADRTGGFARIARIFNTIGHDDPNAHLVPDIIAQIPLGQKSVEISLGNLSPRRDYIHADDTALAITAIAREIGPGGVDVYNVASGKDVSVRELVSLLGEVMGVAITIGENPAKKRRVDRPWQLGTTAKIQQRLDFMTTKSLRIALEDIMHHLGREQAYR
jgi:nucleoside-diphosphate-sugar epimerase